MSYKSGLITGIAGTALAAGIAGAGWWLYASKPGEASKSAPPAVPASVPKPFKEDQATALTLTPDGEKQLAIKMGTVEKKKVKRHREYGGEVTVPSGRSVIVSSPLAGTLKTAGMIPAAGVSVAKGQPVFLLYPVLDPVGRANLTATKVEADASVKNAEEQVKNARIALDRAKKVLEGGAGRQRDVDEAQALLGVAEKIKEGALARQTLLQKVVGDVDAGNAATIPIDAPEDGVIRSLSALAGQTVPAGSPLFEIIDLDQIWVRVPVYVGDVSDLDTASSAAVGGLTAKPGSSTREAKLVQAPPAANPTAGTIDLFYAMDNGKTDQRHATGADSNIGATPGNGRTRYTPGERVGVTIPLKEPAESLTVPWSAVVYDIHGGTWVYERTGDRTYTRRRVIVKYVSEGLAVLASGPPPGTNVVIVGAAELFGTEAGFSK
jgi:cobalt-zinc-cadmium efflux system membrane fusion protein